MTRTNEEIKKAWEVMKKEIKAEAHMAGFTMNKKQIEKRTATFGSCRIEPYDKRIEATKDPEKIRELEALKKQYGTRENEAKADMEKILNSKAFAKFQETAGKTTLTIEKSGYWYIVRFSYNPDEPVTSANEIKEDPIEKTVRELREMIAEKEAEEEKKNALVKELEAMGYKVILRKA